MSFFSEEDKKANGNFDASVNLLPDKTKAIAVIEDASFFMDYYNKDIDVLRLKWLIVDGEFEGRKVNQSLKINDPDKSEKAKTMLANINFNAKGKLLEVDKITAENVMENVANKPMIITLKVWEIEGKSGNWVCEVSPLGAKTEAKSEKKNKAF